MEFNISKKWLNCIRAELRPNSGEFEVFISNNNIKIPEINALYPESFISGRNYLYKVEFTFSIDPLYVKILCLLFTINRAFFYLSTSILLPGTFSVKLFLLRLSFPSQHSPVKTISILRKWQRLFILPQRSILWKWSSVLWSTTSLSAGVLKHLCISRSGYNAWKNPSASEKYRGAIKQKIRKIYEDSHQNYGVPKIIRQLWKNGQKIAVKTVANYMRHMGIKAQWVKPYIQTTIDSDFSSKLHNILNEQFNPIQPDAVWELDITYI